MSDRVRCTSCGNLILKTTADKNAGRCKRCGGGGKRNSSFTGGGAGKNFVSPIIAIGLIVFGIGAWVMYLSGARVPIIGLALPVIGVMLLLGSLMRSQ